MIIHRETYNTCNFLGGGDQDLLTSPHTHTPLYGFIIQKSSDRCSPNIRKLDKGCTLISLIYLRNLPTHTVINSLQTLSNVKSIQLFVVKPKFNIIYILCENFKTIPWVLCKIQLI